MYAKIKHALSLTLAVVMAVTMFACCAFSVSAEDTTADAFVPYEGYTWSPLRGVKATGLSKTVYEDSASVISITDDTPLGKSITTGVVETVENDDGTLTIAPKRKVDTYTDNGDGTATVSTRKTTFNWNGGGVFTNPNPAENNTNFKLGIYSNRECCNGVMYCTHFNPYANRNGNTVISANNVWENAQHSITINDDKSFVSEHPDHDIASTHIANPDGASYYLTESQNTDLANTLMFVLRVNNDMYLEFTAPTDGVYTAKGTIGENKYAGTGTAGQTTKYYFIKVDENGIKHTLTESRYVADNASAESIPQFKVALKAGEKLVLRAGTDMSYVGKLFLKDYFVTKWDYAEAEDKSTVTTSYNYRNHNVLNIYGADYAIGDNNFEALWDVKGARFSADNTTVTATSAFDAISYKDTYTRLYNNNDLTFKYNRYGDTVCSAVTYRKDGTIWAKTDYTYIQETVTAEDGTTSTENVSYNFGLQFTYTVPESGTVELVGGLDDGTKRFYERVGIIKAGTDEIVYGKYISYGGVKQEWNTTYASATSPYRKYELGELNAGDKIVYELRNAGIRNSNFENVCLDQLAVNITTSNSAADFNGDFKADATDAAYLRKVLLRKVEPVDLLMFNITGEDNVVDIRDLVRIKKLLVG